VNPYVHQVVGTRALVKNSHFALFDTMGLGKSKQVIDAADDLFLKNELERVIVIAPAAVRSVWFDPELGEIAKWSRTSAQVIEFHSRPRGWVVGDRPRLEWWITNYDFIRNPERLKTLIEQAAGPKTWLVLDESSAVKNYKAKQTRACKKLRQKCGKVVLLNGTPIAHSPGDLYSQADIMDPYILGCQNWFQFRARYAVMGGWRQKQIIAWRDLEDLQRRLAPYVLCRSKEECLDLPPILPPITLEVNLTPQTWGVYKAIRDEFIAWLDEQTTSIAPQAGVRAMRLAQITSGFLGGINLEEECCDSPDCLQCGGMGIAYTPKPPKELSREKLDLLLRWLPERFGLGEKVLVWCRFRHEVERVLAMMPKGLRHGTIWGGQHRDERAEALRLLDPRTTPDEPILVVGTPGSGSMGLNLAAASTMVFMSNDHSLKNRLQSMDRIHRPGQVRPVTYVDMIATGPTGQRTIDHVIVKALRAKENLAAWTIAAWKKELVSDATRDEMQDLQDMAVHDALKLGGFS
jgi:SNF2 family DNA or RNA helicase